MPWLVILLLGFSGLHFGLLLPPHASIVGGVILTAGTWLVWKLKWVILGIIGLEAFFGGGSDDA